MPKLPRIEAPGAAENLGGAALAFLERDHGADVAGLHPDPAKIGPKFTLPARPTISGPIEALDQANQQLMGSNPDVFNIFNGMGYSKW